MPRAEHPHGPLPTDRLWTQREAAYYLGVSPRYLRESSCPKCLLPGHGPRHQPVIRYDPAQVKAWAAARSTARATGDPAGLGRVA